MKQGAPACGLYLRIPADPDMEATIQALRQAMLVINRSDYERNMHVIEVCSDSAANPEEAREKASVLAEIARLQGITPILRGSAGAARAAGADGVLLEDIGEMEAARAALGEASIIGVSCGLKRSIAQKALEAGADFVSFGLPENGMLPSPDLIGWWSALTEVPALAAGPVDNDGAGAFVRAGAGFLDCWAYIAGHEKGVMQGTVNMLYAIDLALESVKAQ
jgi:thiamine monophosphate synthase